jgi:hypothetical protein
MGLLRRATRPKSGGFNEPKKIFVREHRRRGKGYFDILRLYGPKEAFFKQTCKPDDLKRVAQ